jgi:hypothetical protein
MLFKPIISHHIVLAELTVSGSTENSLMRTKRGELKVGSEA